jgi:plastocyanin
MHLRATFALLALLLSAPVADAAELLVTQKSMQFQENGQKLTSLSIKPGDTLVFRNDDRSAHNVFSRTPGYEFNIGTMRTGGSGTRTFEKAGELDVECALHPQMKFRLTVAP